MPKDAIYDVFKDYKNILDSLTNGVIITDLNKIIRYMNTAAQKISKLPYEQLLNHSCALLDTPYCGTDQCCVECCKRNEKGNIQYGPDGTASRVDISLLHDRHGNPVGYISVTTDVEALVETQRQLRISQERYEVALQYAKTALWEYDLMQESLHLLNHSEEEFSEMFDDIKDGIHHVPQHMIETGLILPDSIEYLKAMKQRLENGEKNVSAVLHMKSLTGQKRWIEITCTNIFDEAGKPIKAIGISKDITEQRELKASYENEKEYRELMSSGFLSVFEINLSDNRILHINEEWRKSLHLSGEATSYEDLLHALLELVKPEHRMAVINNLQTESLLMKFQRNIHQLSFEYEKLIDDTYHWVNTTVNLLQKKNSQDIYACVYLKNIDLLKQKEKELEVEIEIDPLTNTMNRRGLMSHIDHRLRLHAGMTSALMVLDIDNFKQVNDTFGHLYGDAVLSEMAEKIGQLCRKDTLIGRLGGDEFVIFFSHLKNKEDVEKIAERLCTSLKMSCNSSMGKVNTSISLGIALAPDHGLSFMELYEKADMAMYHSKKGGKDQWSLFRNDMKRYMEILQSMDKDSPSDKGLEKPFESNIGEYIFQILYRKKDQQLELSSILELLCRHYDMDYGYIYEYDQVQDTLHVMHEWALADKSDEIPYVSFRQELQKYLATLEIKNQVYFMENTQSSNDQKLSSLCKKTSTYSITHLSASYSNHSELLLGMSDHGKVHPFTRKQKNEIRTVFEVISIFLRDQRQQHIQNQYITTLFSVLDNIGHAVYMIDPDTYRLTYYNHNINSLFPALKIGDICYQTFRGLSQPCADCTIHKLRNSKVHSVNGVHYNAFLHSYLKSTAINVEWPDGKHYVLLSCVDVTDLKNS